MERTTCCVDVRRARMRRVAVAMQTNAASNTSAAHAPFQPRVNGENNASHVNARSAIQTKANRQGYPPTGDRFQWRVLSHLAPNYLSLLNAEILRGSLALYDWTDGELNRRRIDAITDVQHRLVQKLMRGGAQRGVEIIVTIDSGRFAGDGDLQLFGGMLNRFLGLYASLNLYTKLVIVSQPTGRRIEWPDTKSEGAPF